MNGILIIFWKKKYVKMYYVCFRLGNIKKIFMYVIIKKKNCDFYYVINKF